MNRRKLSTPISCGTLIIILFLMPLFITGQYTFHILIMVGINIVLACSLRLIATTGQFSLCHGGMTSVGAYTSALLVTKLGLSSWVALPLAGLMAMSIALIVAYPFTRLKGIYFAMVTVFLGEVISLTAEQWRSLTGGVAGIIDIPHPNPVIIFGLLIADFSSKVDFYYFILILVLVTLLILYAIESSPIGMSFLSIKQEEYLAESVGINSTKFKVIAFSTGAFFAGIAGAFYSHFVTAITADTFGFFLSIYVAIYMIVGGTSMFYGPILGAIVLTAVPELARGLKEFVPFVFAGVLMIIIFFLPEGLVGLPRLLIKIRKDRYSNA